MMRTTCCIEREGAAPVAAESTFSGYYSNLFDTTSYPPRWECGQWSSLEGWLHIGSDIGIFAAYLLISSLLVLFVRRHRDLPFNSLFFLFSAFILLCGSVHLFEAVIFYWPAYRVLGLMKLVTAVVSCATAVVLLRLIPEALKLPGLMATNEKLRRADAAKSEFLANMSHEIRTPMTAILGYAEVLLESGSEKERTECAETIRRNGQHLLAVLNDILDLSKIEAGKLTVEHIACDVPSLVRDVVSLQSARAESKDLSLRTTIASDCPPIIASDPVRLRQVLLNIVGNAIKFTEQGGVEIRVTRHASEDKAEFLRFSVMDTGIGLSDDQLANVFNAFSQADTSTSRRFGGTGLGLAISRRLMELMGGTILVESEVGLGSTFTILLPMEMGVAQKSPGCAEPGLVEGAEVSKSIEVPLKRFEDYQQLFTKSENPLENLRILLAEDGIDNQRLISHILRKRGATVEVADNGAIAVERLLDKESAFDAVLMDMQMPVLDGYQATRKLRSEGYVGPIIALTAHAMAGDRFRCLDAGCDDYLTKPVDREAIVDVLFRLTTVGRVTCQG